MSMLISDQRERPLVVALTAMLAGCGDGRTDHATLAEVEAGQRKVAEAKGNIICARAGSDDYARVCTVDSVIGAEGTVLTLRHPDGGFRRLLVTKDGRGVVAADGAEPAKVSIIADGQIEVALGGDRFRLPATVKAGAGAVADKAP